MNCMNAVGFLFFYLLTICFRRLYKYLSDDRRNIFEVLKARRMCVCGVRACVGVLFLPIFY